MRFSGKLPLVVLGFCAFSYGQSFSVGIKAGVPLTDAVNGDIFNFAGAKKYVVGPMVELHLPLGFSVEADGLYRPLNVTSLNRVITRPSPLTFNNDYSSWEIPILGKFHLPLPIVKPYVEAGPSFRVVDGSIGSSFSKSGFTAGAGVELKLWKVRIGPEIRYTRWREETSGGPAAPSAGVNQAEFLVGFSF